MRCSTLLLGALCASLAFAQTCDEEIECEYTTTASGSLHYWDMRSLCRSGGGDYYFNDGLGHDYYANICGTTAQNCLPKGWDNTFERGVAIQMWGGAPACDHKDPTTLTCIEKIGQVPACCTRDCQVLGVGAPTYSLHDDNDITAGLHVSFTGAVPANDDPFWCPWNPNTGSQYPRTVSYLMLCDKSVTGAVPVEAIQNTTEDCDYHLTFKSAAACPASHPIRPFNPNGPGGSKGLSGGWIFVIIVVCLAVVYFGGGFLYTYHTERVWAPPNRQFWSALGGYTSDGVGFIFSGCQRSSSKGGMGASPYDEIGGGGGAAHPAPGAFAASSYNASSDQPAASTAYTDI